MRCAVKASACAEVRMSGCVGRLIDRVSKERKIKSAIAAGSECAGIRQSGT
jgi:hypothetical protein